MSGFRPRFFIDCGNLDPQEYCVPAKGAELRLSRDDSHHALRVLRLKAGDLCEVVVGTAAFSASVGTATDPVKVLLEERLEGRAAGASYRSRVGLVQASLRPSLLDQVIGKGTEVGASFFFLVPAAGSPRVVDLLEPSRVERWRRIALEAAKQSKHLEVPSVESFASFEDVRETLSSQGMLSLVLEPSATLSLEAALGQIDLSCTGKETANRRADRTVGGIALWIGPESGWSEGELDRFAEEGFGIARMGQSVLRAETAGTVAVAGTRLATGDW